MQKVIHNKSRVSINDVAAGSSILVETDVEGTPLEYKWRKSLKAAEIDNSLSIESPAKQESPKQAKSDTLKGAK